MFTLDGTVSSILTGLQFSYPISLNTSPSSLLSISMALATSPIHFTTDKPSKVLSIASTNMAGPLARTKVSSLSEK